MIPKIVLPTLPELLSFVVRETGGRVVLTSEIEAEAAALEVEAQQIEAAYSLVLDYMQIWQDYKEMTSNGQPDCTATSAAASASELRSRIIRVYQFIADDAGPGTTPQMMDLLQSVSDWLDTSGILRQLNEAAVAGREDGGDSAGIDNTAR